MATETLAAYAVMEGKGSYNMHTTITADGAALAVPFLEKALHSISLDGEERSVVVADMDRRRAKTRWLRCRSPFGTYVSASDQIGEYLFFTSISHRTISIQCSKC